jgi:hypothetical protein
MQNRYRFKLVAIVSFSVLALAVLLGIILNEDRARYCGASVLVPDLPFGIRPRWFDGAFWLEDADGWGLITPTAGGISSVFTFQSRDGESFGISGIVAYAHGRHMYVRVLTNDQKIRYAIFNSPHPNRRTIVLLTLQEFLDEIGSAAEDLHWHSVSVSDCAYGRFGFIRLILFMLALALLAALVRQFWSHS